MTHERADEYGTGGSQGPQGAVGNQGASGAAIANYANATGTTGTAFATIFDVDAGAGKGLVGCAIWKNTDGANTMRYQLTTVGMDGSSQVTAGDVGPGSDIQFDPSTNWGASNFPFRSVKLELQSKIPGSPATYAVYAAILGG